MRDIRLDVYWGEIKKFFFSFYFCEIHSRGDLICVVE